MMLLAVLCIPEVYWCAPINPDGKELACGYEYAKSEVRVAVILMQIFGAGAFIVTAWYARQRRLALWGLCGLALSALLGGLLVFLKLRYGIEDSP